MQLHGARSVAVPPTSDTIVTPLIASRPPPPGIAADTKNPPRARRLLKLAGSPGGTCGNSSMVMTAAGCSDYLGCGTRV